MADDFSERYGDLLTSSYDCVDRVVLNAYFPVGHNPGGFRCWWRRLHGSDDQPGNTHLMRMVVSDLACAIADGTRAISDFRVMGDARELLGSAASVPTAWRALEDVAWGGDRRSAGSLPR